MSKSVKIGNLNIGGINPIAIQTMADIKTENTSAVIAQMQSVEKLGCDIFRVAVLDEKDAKAIKVLKQNTQMPLVADIHFDYRLAIAAIESGVDKVRINPGNIGSEKNIQEVASALKANNVAVRVGSNSGSVNKDYLEKYGKSAEALAESALANVAVLEKYGIKNIVISVKASDVGLMVEANRYLAKKTDYPLHLGVTEAGVYEMGIIKSSVGIGALLLDNIGATIRVSLSDSTEKEIEAAKNILRAVGADKNYVEVISCPTCGRTRYDCKGLAALVSERTRGVKKHLKVAVMGCVVNGPGEAKDADIGIAGGGDKCAIFKKGEVIKTVPSELAQEEFLSEISKLIKDGN